MVKMLFRFNTRLYNVDGEFIRRMSNQMPKLFTAVDFPSLSFMLSEKPVDAKTKRYIIEMIFMYLFFFF